MFSTSEEITEAPELRICVPKIGIEDDSEVTMIKEKLPSYLRKAMGQINQIVQLRSKGEVNTRGKVSVSLEYEEDAIEDLTASRAAHAGVEGGAYKYNKLDIINLQI